MSDTNVSFTNKQTDGIPESKTVKTDGETAKLHPNQGGNRGGFGLTNKGYIPTPEEVAEAEKIRLSAEE